MLTTKAESSFSNKVKAASFGFLIGVGTCLFLLILGLIVIGKYYSMQYGDNGCAEAIAAGESCTDLGLGLYLTVGTMFMSPLYIMAGLAVGYWSRKRILRGLFVRQAQGKLVYE